MSHLVIPTETPRWIKITKTFSDFSAAALTNDIEIYSQLENQVIHSVLIRQTASFTGGAIATYTISAGYAGALTTLTGNSALDVFQAPSNTSYLQGNNSTPVFKSFTGATSVRAKATSSVGNLSDANQGSIDFYLLISTL